MGEQEGQERRGRQEQVETEHQIPLKNIDFVTFILLRPKVEQGKSGR